MIARSLGPAAALLCATAVSAQDAPFLDINPSWPPDGRSLVFESLRHGPAQLFVIGADGIGERRLTRSDADDTHPAWSPDGAWIVFDSNRDGVWNLYLIRPDGTGERRLTFPGASRAAAFARHPQWSPDGGRIVFDSDRDGDGEVYVMRADGSGPVRLTDAPGEAGHAAFAPDGRWILLHRRP